MLVFKKTKPVLYHSQFTGASFKFRQSNAGEREKLEVYAHSAGEHRNNENLLVSWVLEKEDYYAAWLIEDFSGVEDENGSPHNIASFDLPAKAGLVRTLRQSDPEFPKWFAMHCEDAVEKTVVNKSIL